MKPIEIKIAWQGNSDCNSCSIRSSVLFAELNEEDFSKIHSPIDDLRFEAQSGIYSQGYPAEYLYTLREGYIKLLHLNSDGSSRIVRLVMPGDLFGMEALLGESYAHSAPANPELLQIIDKSTNFIVKTSKGPIEITRVMTPCAKNKGWLQPLIPIKGVVPVDEIDVLNALNDKDSLVVDMRVVDDRVKGTIPGSVGIPYTEVAMRMDELGCKKPAAGSTKWDCSKAKKVYAFCNGPVCPQSPMAMAAMTRDGFPATKIYYYRGGMLDWDALGLTTIKGEF